MNENHTRSRAFVQAASQARWSSMWLGLFSLILAAVLAAALVLLAASQAKAAPHGTTYSITAKFDDNTPNNFTCTLREAIMAANSDTAYDACPAGSGADTINLQAGTYTLTIGGIDDASFLGDLDITQSLTINGAGADSSIIKAANGHRVFDIDPSNTGPQLPSSVNVLLQDLTIRDGVDVNGAGIRNKGILTIADSVIFNNQATKTQLPLCPAGCAGGGISNEGSVLTIVNSSVISNTAGIDGGGLISWGQMRIYNSTISGNLARMGGGGIFIDESAPGSPETSDALINNVTVTDNRADTDQDNLGDGGGVYFRHKAVMTATNSLLAGNFDLSTGGSVPSDCFLEIHQSTLPIHSGGYNLIGAADVCSWVPASGDLSGTASSPLDPVLGVLANNGASTLTHALLPGSPALDKGSASVPGSGGDACEATDQRGIVRPRGTGCDIGAYELDVATVNLGVTISDSSDPALLGSILRYTITVDNAGPDTASGVTMTDTLPVGSRFVQAATGCSHTSGSVVCNMGTIPAGSDKTVTIDITLGSGVSAVNHASVTANQPDAFPGNNQTSETTTILATFLPVLYNSP